MKRPINGQNGSQNQPNMIKSIKNNEKVKKEIPYHKYAAFFSWKLSRKFNFYEPPFYVNIAYE